MAAKVDLKVYHRIIELKTKYALTNTVIAERLGISHSTVKAYLRAHRRNQVPERLQCIIPQ